MPIKSVSDPISYSSNYAATKTSDTAKKVATNPRAWKKVLQIATKAFAAIDLFYHGATQGRPVTDAMKGSVELIEFYGTFKDIMFWINPFSKETLDQTALLDSLKETMAAPLRDIKARNQNELLALEVFDEVINAEEFYSKGEVREVLILKLEDRGYQHKFAEKIAEGVIIQQKKRPITLLFSMACFTIADVAGNILVLKKWGILDYAPLAALIGSQSRVFAFVLHLGADTVLGTVASAGLIVSLSEATYRAILQAIKKYQSTDPDAREQASKELRTALLDMLENGVDLVYTAAPLLFVISPPVMVALAIFAKGTGLIVILVR